MVLLGKIAGNIESVGSLGRYWSSTIIGNYINLLQIERGTGVRVFLVYTAQTDLLSVASRIDTFNLSGVEGLLI